MIYQTKHINNRPPPNNFFRIFLILFLTTVLVLAFSITNPLSFFVFNTFSPLFKIGDYFYETFSQVPIIFSDKNKIIAENKKLSDELENMRLNLIDYESIQYENDRLHQELNLKPEGNFIGAKVIAKPPQIPLDSLLVDKGTEDGLSEGDVALASKRVLIGKVVKVFKNRATIALSSFSSATSNGYVERTGEPLDIKGLGGGSIQAKVPIDFDIALQDKIMLEGSRSYAIAVVNIIENDSASGFKNILMSLPANIPKTRIIFIEPFISQ